MALECHGKNKFLTVKANFSRQKQKAHGKNEFLTAIANLSRQKQKVHGKIIKVMVKRAKAKTVILMNVTRVSEHSHQCSTPSTSREFRC